jgi:hypothetical protein
MAMGGRWAVRFRPDRGFTQRAYSTLSLTPLTRSMRSSTCACAGRVVPWSWVYLRPHIYYKVHNPRLLWWASGVRVVPALAHAYKL